MKDENFLIDINIVITAIYIISLSITIYNLNNKKKRGFDHHHNENHNLRLFNRIFLIAIYLAFSVPAFLRYKESHSRADLIGFIGALIAVIPPILFLYGFYIADIERNNKNPIL